MKYWGFLLAKLAAVAGFLAALWAGLQFLLPAPEPFMRVYLDPFARDLGYTFAVLFFGLIAVGLVYLVLWDQRYRCRTCLRRLRMPLAQGTWKSVLLGPPRTEYICPFGHGTLRVPDLHLASPAPADWHSIDNIWQELDELSHRGK